MSAAAPLVARCPDCGRRLSVTPRGSNPDVDVFPRHPPGRRRCKRSRTEVAAAEYVGTGAR